MGSGTSRSKNADNAAAKEREEVVKWRNLTHFRLLPPRGMEEFSKSLSPGDRRRLQFWRQGFLFDDVDFSPEFLQSFVDNRDPDKVLKDMHEDAEKVAEILGKAADVAEFVKELRDRMEPDLSSAFDVFQKQLEDKLKKMPK